MTCAEFFDETLRATQRINRIHAEIREGVAARWHVLIVQPTQENTAAAHLSARRFGVYLPEFHVKRIVKGATVLVRKPIFPGYLFLWCWDVLAHMRRIHSCPGVVRLLYDRSVPAIMDDGFINRLQQIEWKLFEERKDRKRKRRKRRSVDYDGDDIVRVSCYSALDHVAELDAPARISLLHRALGLA